MTTTTRRSRSRDRGFTFVEMLITVGLVALVSAVVAAAVIVILRNQDGVIASTAESHDTRQVVSYLPLDIESGPSRADAYRAAIGGEPGDRGSGCDPVGNDNVLRIDITDRRNDTIDKRIAYRLVTTADEARIDRYECREDISGWITDRVLNVADYLDPDASPIAEAEIFVANPADPIDQQEVTGVELRYVQRGDEESILAAPREEQPLSSTGVCGSDPLEATRDMATFVEGDVILHGTAVKSSLFVGGVLTFDGGTVAQAVPPPPSPPVPSDVGLIAGSIDWANSSGELDVKQHRGALIEDGNYYTPDSNGPITENSASSSPRIELGNSATIVAPAADPLIAAGEAFAELRTCSDRLAELPNSCDNGACAVYAGLPPGYPGTATASGPQLDLTITLGKANAFNIDVANLIDLETIQLAFDGPSSPGVDEPLIINVRSPIGGTVDFEAPAIQGSGSNSIYIVWNFPNADVVNVQSGQQLRGTIMAPYAEVTSYANIEGGVIAHTFEMFGSSLNDVRSFEGLLAW